MDLLLGRLTYTFTPTSFSPHGYLGLFYDPDGGLWVTRFVSSGTPFTAATLQTAYETTYGADTFLWSQAAPPA